MRVGALYDSDTDALERRIPVGKRPVFADIEVKDGQLSYRPLGKAKFVGAENEPRKLLEDFLALVDGSDAEIEAYARSHGVLGLCAHGLPAGHENLRTRLAWIVTAEKALRRSVRTIFDQFVVERHRRAPAEMGALCFPLSLTAEPVLAESLSLWRAYASLAGSLLEASVQSREQDREVLAETLDHWLSLAPLRPACALDKHGRLALILRPVHPLSALFGVLGAQVFFAASGNGSLLICSGCGRPYMSKPLPRTGTHTYCRKCGIRAAWRDASQRYYRKKRKENDDGTQTQRG